MKNIIFGLLLIFVIPSWAQKNCVLVKQTSNSLQKPEYEVNYAYLPNGNLASEEKIEWTTTGEAFISKKIYNYSGKNKLNTTTYFLNDVFQKTVYYVFDKKDNQIDEYTSFTQQPTVKNPVSISANGNMTKSFYDEAGKLTGTELKEYNSTGKLLKREMRDADNAVSFNYTFDYDGDKLKSKSKSDKIGRTEETTRYSYTSNNLPSADSSFVNGKLNSVMTYAYDADNHKVKQTHYSSDHKVDYYIDYAYNTLGLLEEETFYYYGVMLHSTAYEYDAYGNKVTEIYKDQKPLRIKTWEYTCPK